MIKSSNDLLALLFLALVSGIFMVVLLRQLGGSEAVFAILGYVAGWMSSIVMFFYRKRPGDDK